MTTRAVVPDVLADRAKDAPDHVFVECGAERRTFAQMRDAAERVACGLAALGATKGDRVASILPNCIEHVELIFACARLGAIHVPVNVFLKGDFLRYQLADAGASVVVADADGLAAVGQVRSELPRLAEVVAVDRLPAGDDAPPVSLGPQDALAIVYTSGTTGMPKGCMLPHGYHINSAVSGREMLDYRAGDVLYTVNPLFHGWARGMLFGALVHRMTAVIDAEFSAANAIKRIAETQATVFSGVGAMGMAMLAQPASDADRANNLRVAFMIPFPPDAQRAFTERFGAVVQSQMYGQTEPGAISFSRLNEEGNPASVGRPSPQYDVRVDDDGEILVRARSEDVMYTGYWNKPDETAEAMRGGWHHTGDLGRFDDDGFLYFVDRKKDALRRRGENISSVQLEAVIGSHPKIAESAVVAVASELTEDEIKVCIVVTEPVSPDELFEFFREKLPYFAIPRYVEIVDALPKTATMRVQKHVLRDAGVTDRTWDFERLGLTVAREARRR